MTETAAQPEAPKPAPKPRAKPQAEPSAALSEALVAAQAAMPGVKKDAKNPHYQSQFMSLDNLIGETRGVLNEHGLALVQFPTVSELGAPVLRTMLIHGPTGDRL